MKLKLNTMKLAVLGLALLAGTSNAFAFEISKSVCTVEKLDQLGKPAIDLLGTAVGYFDCVKPIGATEPKNRVIAYVSEHDYANIAKIYKQQSHVEFEFDGTYAGKLFSYDGILANHSPLKVVRTGIEVNGKFTTYTFRDVKEALKKNINLAFEEVGQLNLEEDGIRLSLTSNNDGIGELKLTVLTSDISHQMLAVSANIKLPNGQALASDQIEISGRSPFVISNLLIRAGMAVNRGSTPPRPGHHGQFWDYVYLDKDGKDPLFHCANVHSGEAYTKCYISQLRLK